VVPQGIKADKIGVKAIKVVNSIVNVMTLTIIVLLLAFAGYALWDSNQIYQTADKAHYAIYKPSIVDEGKSFKELQAINAEVFAWLSIYGTNIDYPVTQGPDNMKYVNTNAEGLYSLSGSIFLDHENSKDFSDFNNIVYGHHMEKKAMFGEIGNFSDRNVFDLHRYGNLYFDGENHGIEFFAFIHTDAYDSAVFTPNVTGEKRQECLDNLLANAVYKQDIGITTKDHIILLSTCSSSSTNGRDILIGRITEEVYKDTTIQAETNDRKEQMSIDSQYCIVKTVHLWPLLLILILAVRLIVDITVIYKDRL
jgi:sortase B